jgi:hypothetical protein
MKVIDWSASAQHLGPERRYLLRIAGVHEDSLPREWSTQVARRAIQVVGPRCVHAVCWPVGALRHPGAMQVATEAAIEADLLVVSVCGAKELSPNFNRWIDSWLPCRLQQTGALVAVIGVPQQPNAFPARIREYLHDVARLAHMDFLPQERGLPLEYPSVSGEAIARGARGNAAVLS